MLRDTLVDGDVKIGIFSILHIFLYIPCSGSLWMGYGRMLPRPPKARNERSVSVQIPFWNAEVSMEAIRHKKQQTNLVKMAILISFVFAFVRSNNQIQIVFFEEFLSNIWTKKTSTTTSVIE